VKKPSVPYYPPPPIFIYIIVVGVMFSICCDAKTCLAILKIVEFFFFSLNLFSSLANYKSYNRINKFTVWM